MFSCLHVNIKKTKSPVNFNQNHLGDIVVNTISWNSYTYKSDDIHADVVDDNVLVGVVDRSDSVTF